MSAADSRAVLVLDVHEVMLTIYKFRPVSAAGTKRFQITEVAELYSEIVIPCTGRLRLSKKRARTDNGTEVVFTVWAKNAEGG